MTQTRRPIPVEILMVVEQLRRRVPGGSGTYVAGVLEGLGRLWAKTDADKEHKGHAEARDLRLTLYASRNTRRAKQDPLAAFGFPVVTAPLPAPVLTRAWDSGVVRVPGGFSIVHGSSLAVPRERGIRTIVTVHDLAWRLMPEAYPRHGRRWHEMAFVRSMEAGDEFVVPSAPVAVEVRAAGVEEEKVVVIEPGSDHLPHPDQESSSAAARMLSGGGVEGRFVLSVCTLQPRKNLAGLIKAFEAVRGSMPGKWSLVVVGPQGWGPGVAPTDGVVLLGSVSPGVLSALYEKAGMLAYVPFVEGYGLPPLEAMRAGTPVVSSWVPSIGEPRDSQRPNTPNVRNTPNAPYPAYVVDPHRTDEIAGGLLAVASDEDLRGQLISRGRERAAALTWESCASRHVVLWSREPGAGQRTIRT